MSRVKRGVQARAKHKKVMAKAKGYYGARSRVFRVAKQAVIKAGQYAYRDRRQRIEDRAVHQRQATWCGIVDHRSRVGHDRYARDEICENRQ